LDDLLRELASSVNPNDAGPEVSESSLRKSLLFSVSFS
jgi:hypothetical protein